MRSYFESLEENHLESYAIKSRLSKGRTYIEPPSPTRTCFQRDRDRIIHSRAFRRLKDKTQVFGGICSDHVRSRLTHTLEVAQISRHLARLFRVNEDLTECIALSHDLGHPPFGHSGESLLNEKLSAFGGFEHNRHSLKILELLEKKYPSFPGLNLSFEVKEGLKKHCMPWNNKKNDHAFICIEAQIANIADEIAYNNHDLDDGLRTNILNEASLNKHINLWKYGKKHIKTLYQNLNNEELIPLINSHIISTQVLNVYNHSQNKIKQARITSLEELQSLKTPLIEFSDDMKKDNNQLRTFLNTNVYRHPKIEKQNKQGQSIILEIFEKLSKNPQLLPSTSEEPIEVQIGDFIAGMTDQYALSFNSQN